MFLNQSKRYIDPQASEDTTNEINWDEYNVLMMAFLMIPNYNSYKRKWEKISISRPINMLFGFNHFGIRARQGLSSHLH